MDRVQQIKELREKIANPKKYYVRVPDVEEPLVFDGHELIEHEGSLFIHWFDAPERPELAPLRYTKRLVFRAAPGGWFSYWIERNGQEVAEG